MKLFIVSDDGEVSTNMIKLLIFNFEVHFLSDDNNSAQYEASF